MFLFTDAKTNEFLQMKIFNQDLNISDSEMHEMLKNANLTGHGYRKEVTVKQRQNADTGEIEYEVKLQSFCMYFCAYECEFSVNQYA